MKQAKKIIQYMVISWQTVKPGRMKIIKGLFVNGREFQKKKHSLK